MELVKKTSIPGPLSKKLHSELLDLEAPNLTLNDPMLSIVWDRSSGTRIFDIDGNEYIDFASGLNVANVGHSNPEVVGPAKEQMDKQLQGMGDFHTNTRKVEFLKKLTEISPIKNPKFIVSVNGSDAVDSALKTATLYTGKSNFISFYGAYHGLGAKSLEVTARNHFREPFTKDINKNTTFLPYPYSYRWPFNKDSSDCASECLSFVKQTIENSATGTHDVAAIIIESFQGRGGVLEAPKEFLKGLRELCDEHGILLIVDEILSGFGRTGKWFGIQHSGIEPDLVTIGKGLSSGYPISACIGKAEIMDKAWGEFSGESIHTSTFQGNPVGCSLAIASIDYIKNNNLLERSQELGAYFKERLKEEIFDYPIVGDIRGKGLMIGIEFVTDKETKQPSAEICWNVMRKALQEGVLLLNGGHQVNVVCLTPPLVITKEEIDYCVSTLKKAIAEISLERSNTNKYQKTVFN